MTAVFQPRVPLAYIFYAVAPRREGPYLIINITAVANPNAHRLPLLEGAGILTIWIRNYPSGSGQCVQILMDARKTPGY